jgi:hypothetical protein
MLTTRLFLNVVLVFIYTRAASPQQTPIQIANDRGDAIGTIKAAINAHGGAPNIKKAQVRYTRLNGKMFDGNKSAAFTDDRWVEPGRIRSVQEIAVDEQTRKVIIVVDAGNASRTIDGIMAPLSKSELMNAAAELHMNRVFSLYPLAEEQGFKLSAATPKEFVGSVADGVKIEAEGQRTFVLYFDRKTRLLTAAEFVALQPDGKEFSALPR